MRVLIQNVNKFNKVPDDFTWSDMRLCPFAVVFHGKKINQIVSGEKWCVLVKLGMDCLQLLN